ncbi:MAG TPA: ribosome silencing factor [Candidatus Krumholzibacteria bacterium]|nr:ribosome silencing factor [Candidatus Krumholzibacteria bacterium]
MTKRKTAPKPKAAPKRKVVKTPLPAPRRSTAVATRATARKVAAFALEKKAVEITVMDVRKVTDVTRFFVVCSGQSTSQVKAIADHVIDSCRESGLEIYHVEGYDSLRWVLIDLVDIVVHVFQPDVRRYYQLERLWGDAPSEQIDEPAAGARS